MPLSDDTLMEGYKRAKQEVLQNVSIVGRKLAERLHGQFLINPLLYENNGWVLLTEGDRFADEMNMDTNAMITHAMAAGTPYTFVRHMGLLAPRLRTLAMALNNVHSETMFGTFWQTDITDTIESLLETGIVNWNVPAMRRFLLRVVPPAAMQDFIDDPESLTRPALAEDMRAARADKEDLASMEIAMLGRAPGMHSDVAQLLAQRVAPIHVTQGNPLRQLTSAAQRARDAQLTAQFAQQAPPTNTDVLDEIIAEFEDTDADTLKRKLIDLRESIKKQKR